MGISVLEIPPSHQQKMNVFADGHQDIAALMVKYGISNTIVLEIP